MKIGVLGCGQLGRMLALAGYPLGIKFKFFDTVSDAPAGQLTPLQVGRYDDEEALLEFTQGLDVITYEFENVPVEAVKILEKHVPIYPPAKALEYSQDRLTEKTMFRASGVPVPDFYAVNTLGDLQEALSQTKDRGVLKTRRMGYDGKGQGIIRSEADRESAWQALQGQALILESFMDFEREVSIIAVRGRTGASKFYPLVENYHEGGILRKSIAPAEVSPQLQGQAEHYAKLVMERLEYVGVLAIEFFVVNGQLVANEMAPRVHNSGHWTIEGAVTSQFENHIRAVAGLPLGSTEMRGSSVMLNLIGVQPKFEDVLKIENVHLHWYGKSVRSGRKVGHITVAGQDINEKARLLEAIIQNSF
ncbi:MAG: 5-(carboxyamino)imidazole ribonucleotide synthase [Trueperaceae bacterium]